MDWSGGNLFSGGSSSNSRDHSSSGMYPPSMYDTSVSSKSTTSQRRFPRSSPPPRFYASTQQHQQHQQQPQQQQPDPSPQNHAANKDSRERPVVVYPSRSMDSHSHNNNNSHNNNSHNYSHSFDYSPRYRSVAMRSDPGGPSTIPISSKVLMETQSDVGGGGGTGRYSPTNNNNSSSTHHHHYHRSNSFATTTSSQDTSRMTGGRTTSTTTARYNHHHARYQSFGGIHNGISNTRSSFSRSQSFSGPSDRNVRPLKETIIQQPQISSTDGLGSSTRKQQQQQHVQSSQHNLSSSYNMEVQEELTGILPINNTSSNNLDQNESDINSSARIETPSPVNIKELKRQLWNEQEILQVPSASPMNRSFFKYAPDNDDLQQSSSRPFLRTSYDASGISGLPSSPLHQHHPLANSRYARSLSPARRNHYNQQSSSLEQPQLQQPQPHQQQPRMVPYAGSTISDSSSGNRFHSKFYEAALVARMRGKMVPPVSSQSGSASVQSRPFDERSNKTPQQQQRQHVVPQQQEQHPHPSPPSIQRMASTERHDQTRSIQNRRSFSDMPQQPQPEQKQTHHHQSSDYPYTWRPVEQQQHPSQQPPPTDRGRSMEPPLHIRRRTPSPMIQDRILSLSQQQQDTQSRRESGYSHSFQQTNNNDQNDTPINDPRNESFEATIGQFGSVDEGSRGMPSNPAVAVSNNFQEYSSASPVRNYPNQTTLPPPAYKEERYGSKLASSAMESSKERMAHLMARLHSVNRDNPEAALAQIDQILRQESTTSLPAQKKVGEFDGSPQQYEFAMTAPIPPFPAKKRLNGEDGDDDSDVSSITNPTYQGTVSSKQYPDRIKVVSPIDDALTNKNPSLTHDNEQTPPKIPFNPSTSSFRRPRPSHLHNYATTAASAFHTHPHSDMFAIRQPEPIPPQQQQQQQHHSNDDQTAGVPKQQEQQQQQHQNQRQHHSNDLQTVATMQLSDFNTTEDGAFPDNPFDEFIYPVAPRKESPVLPRKTPQLRPEEPILHQTNIEVSLARPSPTPSPNASSAEATPTDSRGKTGKLDRFISDKEALARKIQAWDSLSNSIVKSEPENKPEQIQVGSHNQNAAALTLPRPPPSSSRRHPWDGKVPSRLENIKMRDTSMDDAIGIETEMTFRGGHREMGAVAHRIEAESPQVTASVDTSVPEINHFQKAGQNIRNRAEEYIPVDPTYHIDEKVVEEKKVADEEVMKFPDIPLESTSFSDAPQDNISENNNNLMRNVTKSPEGVYQFSPNNQPYSQGHNNQSTNIQMSEEDSSWVSLPKTSFFSDFKTFNPFGESDTKRSHSPQKEDPPTSSPLPIREDDQTPRLPAPSQTTSEVKNAAKKTPSTNLNRDGPPNAGPVDIDDYTFGISPSPSVDQSGEQAEIEVALTDPKKYVGTNSHGVAMSRTGARSLACQTVPNKEVHTEGRTKEKKKGFLRAFIERKKMKAGGSATVGHAASVAAHSTSVNSRGAKSASHTDLSRNERSTLATPSIQLIPPPPGVMDRRALTPNRGRRDYRINNITRRTRSNSLERFRTPSMAQKFNRVMKLYDDET
ncbi:hypothetical protein IV203_029263 [Nitzschia inconspicua]|uniref:Uncharacterized protein n=1 Tax=Nitzschia inconspicua TaxID=303405 RepID=A0A9K3LQE7_9STRA|nr:hypothetical protein IV203_029263 [Nitzschia inconspicua]